MTTSPRLTVGRALPALVGASFVLSLGGCAGFGSMMSPYSGRFSCKNDDHGQCVHPDQAYADAVAGVPSKSDPAMLNGRSGSREHDHRQPLRRRATGRGGVSGSGKPGAYRELGSLIETPAAPMLQPARTVRTLVLAYADRQRPDRLYMPRFVYSVLDRPTWTIGDTLVQTSGRTVPPPALRQVLGQVREHSGSDDGSMHAIPPRPAPGSAAITGDRP
jgi:conjugal transfer pilus assembly protein TraV